MKPFAFFTAILSSALLAAPAYAFAAGATFFGPIVPDACNCPGIQAAGYGCVLQVIQNLMNAGIAFSTVIMTLVIVYGGFLFISSAANPENRSAGIKMIMGAFIGMVIVLSSWLIVDFFMKTFYGGTFGPWNAILGEGSACIGATQTSPLFNGQTVLTQNPGGGTGVGGSDTSGSPGNTHMNIQAAVAYLDSHAQSHSGGQCALYVRQALAAGGLTQFNNNHPANAYQYGSYLTGAGFNQVSTSINGFSPQAGDVVVFQPVPGHPSGHIAMYDGSQWVSDFKQQSFYVATGYQSGAYAIYRP